MPSVCFFFKPALNSLNKLDFVVTDLLFQEFTIKIDQRNGTSIVYFFYWTNTK